MLLPAPIQTYLTEKFQWPLNFHHHVDWQSFPLHSINSVPPNIVTSENSPVSGYLFKTATMFHFQKLDYIDFINQHPIGKSSRSNPLWTMCAPHVNNTQKQSCTSLNASSGNTKPYLLIFMNYYFRQAVLTYLKTIFLYGTRVVYRVFTDVQDKK